MPPTNKDSAKLCLKSKADDPNNVDQVGLISQMLGILTQYSPNTHRKNCLMKI